MNFTDVSRLKTRKLPNVIRFSGNRLLQPETVSDHNSDMIAIGLYIASHIKSVDKKLLVYKIAIHDFDESLYNDIPRNFKYHNEDINRAINSTVDLLMKENFDDELLNDIHNSKSEKNIESILVKCIDIIQCTFKLHTEVCQLGNLSIHYVLGENLMYLHDYINKLQTTEYEYISRDDKDVLIEFLINIYNRVNHDFSKLQQFD